MGENLEAVFDSVVDRVGILGLLVFIPAAIYLPMVPFGLIEERREQAKAGTGLGPSATLTVLSWCSAIYYVVVFIFGVVPFAFGTVLPSIWRSVTALFPSAQGVLSGTSGLILSAIATITGLVLFIVVAGWAFRLGWRLHDRNL